MSRNKREETEEIKNIPLYSYLLQGQQALPNCMSISVGRPGDVRYTTLLPHLTTPVESCSNQLSQELFFFAHLYCFNITDEFIYLPQLVLIMGEGKQLLF